MKKIKVGMIGLGEMGRCHLENLARSIPQAHLVAVADVDQQRAQTLAAELEVPHHYPSLEALLERKEIEAVVIATPDKFHAHSIGLAAAAGKHIFCEKPIALTLEEADKALQAVARAGVRLQIGHMRRYDPAYAAAKKRIEQGEIGEPVLFKAISRDRDWAPLNYYEANLNGMQFMNSTIHEFDLARWLMGDEVVEVQTYTTVITRPELARFNDIFAGVVNLRFGRGAIGNIDTCIQAWYGYDIRTEVVGSKGTIQIGHLPKSSNVLLTRSGSSQELVDHWLVRFADAYLLELRDFLHSLQTGAAPRVDGEEGRRALAIAVAAQRSFLENTPQPVPQHHSMGQKA